MSSSRRAWMVAASIGAVEALKDQGVCRWNGVLGSLQKHVKNKIVRSYSSQAMKLSAPSISSKIVKRSKEETQKKVMELNCWGPTTVRF
ncbi:hypothetical protein UlMin_003260 [Ulmus minor]